MWFIVCDLDFLADCNVSTLDCILSVPITCHGVSSPVQAASIFLFPISVCFCTEKFPPQNRSYKNENCGLLRRPTIDGFGINSESEDARGSSSLHLIKNCISAHIGLNMPGFSD
jgi:hypothetical protein